MSVDALPAQLRARGLPLGPVAAFLIGVLFLAGAIHISAILLVPTVARNDGWSRLAAFAGMDQFTEIAATGPQTARVVGLDPLFVNGACRLQLAIAPAGIAVEAHDRFWSLALYDPQGTIIFSLNDRTAVEGRLDMLVVNLAQNAALKQTPPAGIEQTIVVEAPSDELIALLRLFAPTSKAQEEARGILAAAECLPAPLTLGIGASGG